MIKILAVIPARYASTRFPGKPLIDLGGKSMIQRVYEQVLLAKKITDVVVATDDERIYNHLLSTGGRAVMTNPQHPSGTDRCYEVLSQQVEAYDYVINVQGDEPFINPDQINLLASHLDGKIELATLIKKIETTTQFESPHVVKVTFTKNNEALYFSRAPIPFPRNPNNSTAAYKHIGMYAYRANVLANITQLPMSSLEKIESLEQLRWLENGYRIKVVVTHQETIGIDTPDDVQTAMDYLNQLNK